MVGVLQIGQTVLDAPTLIAKLKQHQLMPKLAQEVLIDSLIAEIDCDEASALQEFCTKRGLFSQEQQQAWCKQQQQTPAQMAFQAIRECKLAKFQAKTWGSEVESYFLQRKAQLDRVRYSLIRTKDASLAQEIYFRLHDDGEPFAKLATQYTEGQEAKTGGLVGPVELSVPHPILARMLMVSKPGQLWAPTQIGEWLVIAKLEQFLPAQFDEGMRQRLLDEQFRTWLAKQLEEVQAHELSDEVSDGVSEQLPGQASMDTSVHTSVHTSLMSGASADNLEAGILPTAANR
ncbi:MAG: peptidylprolyl isomerase [Phormidesmis sp. RL_2_1]|nr:peptidylprolyl isomerase [Phormidesmis sp. RL_2_1]